MTKNTMRVALRALVVTVLGFLWTGGLAAQIPSALDQQRLHSIFTEMAPETDVQIVTPMLTIERGTFRQLDDAVVDIEHDDETVPVHLSNIRSLSVERSHPIQGMLWGVSVGGLVGTMVGVVSGSFQCRDPIDCADSERDQALAGGIIGGATGLVTGFLIGRFAEFWEPIFP